MVFVSHSTLDRDFIEREIIRPLTRPGLELWYAKDSIEDAAQWSRAILHGLKTCDWFLVVMSPRSARSRWVKHELDWAFQKKPGRIIPALLEDCDADDFHFGLAGLQFIDFRTDLPKARDRLFRLLIHADVGDAIPEMQPVPGIRRLPIYLLVDCSMSMAGPPLEAARLGFKCLVADLLSDPQALETVWLSVITFGSRARQVVPLTELVSFEMPDLQPDTRPGVDMGGALQCFLDAVQRELAPTTEETKGDFMPQSFILVSEASTTPLCLGARMLQAVREWIPPPVIVGLGSGLDFAQLKRHFEVVIVVQDIQPSIFSAFLKWRSAPVLK